ncbi:MAG: class I SAM-dependent methyltransferase [Streptococcus sp.]|nr:class I SAM-dependent methyltransferase [Streptococcus sp.]
MELSSIVVLLIFYRITGGLGFMNMTTYETFAAVYDAVMDDSLYDLWTYFSLRHLPKSKDRKKLLELACGTGIQSVRFSQAGFDVTGLDLSADMLKIAEKRAASAKQKIDFIEGNMLDLSQAGTYDFVTCYSDSICYMQDEVEAGDVFKEVYNALNEDGVFIFDVHSTYQTDEVFPGYSYHENAEDFAMLWDTYEDVAPHSIVHELTFFVQEEDGSFSRHDEVHEERTYEVLTYDILLEQAGFKSFKLYADFEDKEPTKTSKRWFFVAQK